MAKKRKDFSSFGGRKMVKISVVTPSVRPEGLDIVRQSLNRQTFKDFEWIIVTPDNGEWSKFRMELALKDGFINDMVRLGDGENYLLFEPPKNEGDMYSLNKAWNAAFKRARGELIVSFVDMTWAPPDALENFWIHYENNPKALVGGIGHQYAEVQNNKPEVLVWQDPRARTDFGSFYEISPIDLEFCLTSVPRQAIYDIGGWDEKWDQFAALSEKEACLRMDKLGYKFYLDQSIEYRALTHPRLTKDWEERYQKGCEYLDQCFKEIKNGTRLKLDFVK